MGVLWRRPVNYGGERQAHFMLRTVADTRAIKCDFCPCDYSWYIWTGCIVGGCGDPLISKVQVGDYGVQCAESADFVIFEDGSEHAPHPILQAVVLSAVINNPFIGGSGWFGQENFVSPIWTVKNAYLTTIRHELQSPPFDGTATCTLYVDGDEVPVDGVPSEVEDGEPAWLGSVVSETTGGQTCNAGVVRLTTPFQFSDAGAHFISMKVTYTSTDTPPQTQEYWTGRTILVWDFMGLELKQGGLYVAPFPSGAAGLLIGSNGYPLQPTDINNHVFGPYNSFDEAVFVRDEWGDFMGALARTCTCPQCHSPGSGVHYPVLIWDTVYGGWKYEDTPNGGEWGEAGCWRTMEGALTNGSYIRVWDAYGNVIDTITGDFGSYLIAPCTSGGLYLPGDENNPPNPQEGPWGGGEVGGTSPDPCVLTDESSMFYGRAVYYAKDENGIEGIPSNSEELADYLGDKGACELQSGHHWDMGPPAKCVEDEE